MNPVDLQLHDYYAIDGLRYRYMGRTHNNQYIFYADNLEHLVFDDTDLYLAIINPYKPILCPGPQTLKKN
jgi:hypothetical protein